MNCGGGICLRHGRSVCCCMVKIAGVLCRFSETRLQIWLSGPSAPLRFQDRIGSLVIENWY